MAKIKIVLTDEKKDLLDLMCKILNRAYQKQLKEKKETG